LEHPTAIAIILGLYALYSALVVTDNAFKARFYDRNADVTELNRHHDKAFLYGLPTALFVVLTSFAYNFNVGWRAWLYAAPLATGLVFLALTSSYKFGDAGQKKRLFCLGGFIAAFAILDLFLYGQKTLVIYGFILSVAIGFMLYLILPAFPRFQNFMASNYVFFLWLSALYSVIVIGTVLYALAVWLWGELNS